MIYTRFTNGFWQIEVNSLATLALFAYLGRETRLFLSRHGIKVLDKQTRDFVR